MLGLMGGERTVWETLLEMERFDYPPGQNSHITQLDVSTTNFAVTLHNSPFRELIL